MDRLRDGATLWYAYCDPVPFGNGQAEAPVAGQLSATDAFASALSAAPDEVEQDPTRERILDAALAVAAALGLEGLTMDAVAERGRVGRMTVYRRFGTKDDLVRALMVREVRGSLREIAASVDPEGTLEEQVADGFVASLRVARTNPLSERVLRFEPERVLSALNDPDEPLMEMLRSFGEQQLRSGPAAKRQREDPAMVAELLVRIGLSFLLIHPSVIEIEDERVARELARNLIAPLVAGE